MVPLTMFQVLEPAVRAKNCAVTGPPSGSATVPASTGVCDTARSNTNPVGTLGAAAVAGNALATTAAVAVIATTLTRAPKRPRPRIKAPSPCTVAPLRRVIAHAYRCHTTLRQQVPPEPPERATRTARPVRPPVAVMRPPTNPASDLRRPHVEVARADPVDEIRNGRRPGLQGIRVTVKRMRSSG
ncbi:hypothetical protein GCM10010972_34780 [Cellulomonas carbonis]|nr:hypothetical protein GCM10010972_34780 [Cellulomonas carbonis]